jgi:uncharacterized protein involved in outer membrane biogenesis
MLNILVPLGIAALGIAGAMLAVPAFVEWNRARRRLHHRLEEMRRNRPYMHG